MKKRLISLCMAVALLFAMLPQIVLNADAAEVVDSGTCGDNLTWTLDDEGTLTISGAGSMYDYNWGDGVFAPWYNAKYFPEVDMYGYYGSPVKCVIIESGVTSIGTEAFSGCSAIVKVEIADS